MIADTTAYVVSLIKVFCGASVLIFVLPLFMWHNYLKKKSYSYRFAFCVITQNCFLINLVLLLGFLHICNYFTVLFGIVIMFFLILWSLSDKKFFRRSTARLKVFKQVARGEKKLSLLWVGFRDSFLRHLHSFFLWPLWKHIGKNLVEYLVLGAAVIYNVWFLTYNTIRYHCYQFSDIPVHLSWIYQLDHGVLFSDGIYPFGMHAIVYLIHNLFSLDLREVLLYFGSFQTILLMLSVYILSKKIFRWKYASIVVLISFSLLMNQGRYAASLPQECGMFAVALAAYCLICFLHTPLEKHVVRQDSRLKRFFRINQYLTKKYLTTDVLLLMLCVALSIEYHFYTAIAACVLVFSILLAYLGRTMRKQYWVPILMAGILGVVIAVTPFMACYARGTPFQESMQWAMSVTNGQEWQGSESDYQARLESSLGKTQSQSTSTDTANQQEKSAAAGVQDLTFAAKIKFYYHALYDFSSTSLFGNELTKILVICLGVGSGCAAVFLLFARTRKTGMDYFGMILYTIFMCTMGAAQTLNIVQIIAAARASTFAEPFLGIVYAIPVDFTFRILSRYRNKVYRGLLSILSVLMCAALVLIIFRQGWVHHFFDVNLAYYNESEYLTRHIRETYPKDMFTIVSPTEEYYEVVDYGYHVNLSKFMNMADGQEKAFTIPTPYVFFFIEKRVLQDYYYGNADVSLDLAQKNFVYLASSQDYYFQRAVLESQAYYWALAYMKMYPNSFKVYYEDDIYIAYILEQNPYSLDNFQINYLPDEGNQR